LVLSTVVPLAREPVNPRHGRRGEGVERLRSSRWPWCAPVTFSW